jgi:hypothetical protein
MTSLPHWVDELYPTPWRINMRGNRARILASNGNEFYNGMNKEKAVLIVLAVNALALGSAPDYTDTHSLIRGD